MKKQADTLTSVIILGIGIYMIWKFNAQMPPTLSGVAFILLGLQGFCKK